MPKFSVAQWGRNPILILLIISTNIIWALFMFVFNRADSNTDNAYKVAESYRISAEADRAAYQRCTESQQKYINAILFKNAQIENRDKVINTLKHSSDSTVNNIFQNEN